MLIAHTRLYVWPRVYVSSYYFACSHEQTRDRLAGDARVDDPETSRRLPRNIYSIFSLCCWRSLFGHCWCIFYFSFLLLETENLESCNKLYLDFRCFDVDVDFSYQLMHCLTCFMSSILLLLLLYIVPSAVRHSTGSLLVYFLLPFSSDDRPVLTGHVYSALLE